MKQKVAVRVLVKGDDTVLLLRRAGGRETIQGKYELPGGKLGFNEQPKDAARRYLSADLGVSLEIVKLIDVMSFIDPDDGSVQYVFVVFEATLSPSTPKVALGNKYDKYVWQRHPVQDGDVLTTSTHMLLEASGTSRIIPHKAGEEAESDATHMIVYSDGGSRGNPGPSAAGYVVMDRGEHIVAEDGMYLGLTTNNQAEYQAVYLGLQKAAELGARTVDFRVDSMLVVNQMKGVYKIRNRDLWPIHERIKQLANTFEKVTFTHVRREYNKLADGMVNKILDEQHSDKKR